MVNITTNITCPNCGETYHYRDWEDDIAACPNCTLVTATP